MKRITASGLLLALTLSSVAAGTPARAAGRKDLGAAVAPIRLEATGSARISIAGLNSYLDTIELDAAGSGVVVSNRIRLERYLLGLAEVPTSWPAEALKAQVIAARTYALWTLAQGRTGEASIYGYDICATVQCQVFAGAEVLQTPDGDRWRAAVAATEGQTILYKGEPILARYHSTSGGRTIDNEDAFPGEPAYPYLKSVSSTTEDASPLYHWRVTFKIGEIEAMLRRSGLWATPQRLVRVRNVPGSAFYNPDVVFEGEGGARLVRTADEFRDVARDLAPAMFPGRYPSAWNTTSGVLPETLPSERYSTTTNGKTVVFNGTGWGHGTGMSQWGAHGLAQQGASYADILGHYYTGTSVGIVDQPPAFEVGIQTGAPSVTASGAFRIVDGRGKTLVPRALGTWRFSVAGPGAVAIEPPQGYGLPLEVGIVRAPKMVLVGEPAYLTVALSRPARIRTETAESPTGYRDPGVSIKDAGRRRVVWLAPLEEGTYKVRVNARAGPTAKRSEAVEIRVTSGELEAPDAAEDEPGSPATDSDGPSTALLILFGGVLVALITGGVVRARRR